MQYTDADKSWMLANLDYAVVTNGQAIKEINASNSNTSDQPVHTANPAQFTQVLSIA